MPDTIIVTGATAPSGTKFYIARQGENIACIPKSSMKVGSNTFVDLLDDAEITLFDQKGKAEFIQQVKVVEHFPPLAIAERIGWNGNIYALQNGGVLASSPMETYIAFKPLTERVATSGIRTRWKSKLANPLAGHILGELALMVPFVSPLLPFMPGIKNFGIFLVASAGKGKTTLLEFASSLVGQVTDGINKPYWVSLHATDNSLEDRMVQCRDHPFLLDDFSRMTAGQTREGRSAALTKLSYLIEGGTVKGRKGEGEELPCRFVALVTANEGMLDLIDQHNENDVAAADRLLTIKVPAEWKAGVYESVPATFDDGPTFAKALMDVARKNHGTAYLHFMQKLVKLAAKDREALEQRLEGDIAEFIRRSGQNVREGTDYRIAASFGAVYAAGKLAKEFGTLPKAFNPGRTALAAYRLHLAERIDRAPFVERLLELAKRPDILDVSDIPDGSDVRAAATAALGTLHKKPDCVELRIHPSKIRQAFGDWDRIKASSVVRDELIRNNEPHLARKASLAPGMPKTRLFCFRVPNDPMPDQT